MVPVYWELVEPEEGLFDFTLVDEIVCKAREHDLRIIFLWFGAWKNSISCYAPPWIKKDDSLFPLTMTSTGETIEILSPFSSETCNADTRAFSTLMKHIREIDEQERTVIMVQIENEIGMIPDARDYSPMANQAFDENVPEELLDYLVDNEQKLIPEFRQFWLDNGKKIQGTWEEVFGKSVSTDEVFMAWHYAKYVSQLARAGKQEHPIPMYVNAALYREGYVPGQYPSAGTLPHLMYVWRAGAPEIDFIAPDIYNPRFIYWCKLYHRSGNPLFIPEAGRGSQYAVEFLYAIGMHDAIGVSPFSIESVQEPEKGNIKKCYEVLSQLTPLIVKYQGAENITGVVLDQQNQIDTLRLGEYTFLVKHDFTWSWSQKGEGQWPTTGCIIIQTEDNKYFVGGTGVIINFIANNKLLKAGILFIDDGRFVDGQWIASRRLNGDETHQARHLRIPAYSWGIQKLELYTYHNPRN